VSPNAAALLALAESIADGSAIDWEAAEAQALADEQAIVRELRVLANLAGLHRSLPADPGAVPAATLAHRGGAAPAIGSWAHLTLIERLGGGASGDVYRAWDRHLEREVALKLLRGDESVDDLSESRIAREGRLLARVRHPNVITVHGVAAHDQRVGLWMDLVRGVTLEQQLTANGPLSAREAALVGIDLCRALAAIHAAGLIHRDVKAQNVMREDGGRIVLMDLGTSREMAADGGPRAVPDLAGTPLYLAPELFSGAKASERTDLYSLGVLLYRLVTASFPVRAATMPGLVEGHKNGLGVRLRDARADLPTAFVRVVDRAIARDPSQRYASAGALEADLMAIAGDMAVPASVAAPAALSGTRSRRWRTAALASLAAAAAITVIGVGVFRAPDRPLATGAPVGKVKLAVLPLQNLTGRQDLAEWPQLIQTLFVDEVAGVQNVSIADPLSMNTALSKALGTTPARRSPELFEALRGMQVTMVIDGSLRQAGGAGDGYQMQINLIDVATGDTRFPGRVHVASEDALVDAVKSLADGVLGFVQLQVLQLANDKDLRPWLSLRRQNIQAVNALLQATQHIYRYELAAGTRYLERALELDPSFIVPRVWLIPGLVGQGKLEEARASYEYLRTLEASASPFEQAMIAFAGARVTGDLATQAAELETALEYLPGNNILLANLAEIRELKGDCEGALNAMRPAVDMRWQYPPLYSLWGMCMVQTGRANEARGVLRDATSLPAVHPNVYGILEALSLAAGDEAGAARHRDAYRNRLRDIDRPADPTEVLKVYAALARDASARGQTDRALTLRARAAAIQPKPDR
jgi:tRNA A-37 threonylcarbamoyl transferase component Bud32/tetratricopeptide (TPR) repeat protein